MKNRVRNVSLLLTVGAALLVVLVLGLRFWKLGTLPKTLYIDEVAMLADAKALVETGRDMNGNGWFQAIFPSYGDYKMPVYLWTVYVSSLIFGPSNFAVRFPSAVAGIATVLIVYSILQNLSKRYRKRAIPAVHAVWVTCLSVGVSPWAIQFARTGFEAYLGQLLLGTGVLLLLHSRKRISWLLGASAVALLATYTYFSVRYVWVPVYLTWVIVELSITKDLSAGRHWIKRVFVSVLPLVFFLMGMLPLFNSRYYHDSMQFRLSTPSVLEQDAYVVQANEYRQIAGNGLFDRAVAHRWYFAFQSFAKNLSVQLSPGFLFVSGDANLRHGTGVYGLFLLPLILPTILGVYVLARREKRVLLLFLVWVVSAAIPAAVPLEVPHALRFLNALIPISVLVAVGLFEFWQVVYSRKWPKLLQHSIVAGYGALLFFFIASFTCYYFSVYPSLSASAWEQEITEVAIASTPYLANEESVAIVGMHDKFFLWLLAYGPYPGSELSQFTTESFDSRSIPGVHFQFPFLADQKQIVIIPTELYTSSYMRQLQERDLVFTVDSTFVTSGGFEYSVGRVTNEPQEN
ncbi:MAG: hypothetical protein H6773_01415 [Pseudomonadales bacterium]|nr:hypothetical protein [Candidatus Woesebacteria bacterium]MCB9800815.1 hypothetical protein [Pseudomonadales bacterium]